MAIRITASSSRRWAEKNSRHARRAGGWGLVRNIYGAYDTRTLLHVRLNPVLNWSSSDTARPASLSLSQFTTAPPHWLDVSARWRLRRFHHWNASWWMTLPPTRRTRSPDSSAPGC